MVLFLSKLVQLLLHHGANPHQANIKGKTAVNVAATSEIETILRGNSGSCSDIESHSEASSSDSNPSGKEDEHVNIDDGNAVFVVYTFCGLSLCFVFF